jgi:hypothetical protein
MADAFTAQINPAETAALFAELRRAQRALGKSSLQSIQWAARLVCSSLSGQTKKVRAKLRPVVQNPDKRWQTDKRRAPFGVMGYRKGKQKFIPIYRTGEYGKLRFYDRESVSWYERQPKKWRRIKSGPDIANPEIIVPGIMDHKKRNIPHRGLAKKAWQKASSRVGRGGTVGAMGVSSIASVFVNRNPADPSITINNKLRYAEDALKGGRASVNTAVENATKRLSTRIDQEIAKALGIKWEK